jgi:uncharacterized protein YkwD
MLPLLPARGRLLLPLVAAVAALCASLASTARAAPCPTTDARSTLQLLNTERAAHALPALRFNARLTQAAEAYSCDMVARHFFEHVSPSGERLQDRVAATGWLRHRPGWALGETLGWGTGQLATPASIVAAWMKSPPHRAIVLRRRYHAVGIGIAIGTPFQQADGATFTADFGGGRRVRR